MSQKPKGQPLFDPFGKLIGETDRAIVTTDGDGNVQSVRKGISPDRVLSRNVGCFNCKFYDAGSGFEKRVQDRFITDYQYFLERQRRGDGKIPGSAKGFARRRANMIRMDMLSKKGFIGICTIGAAVDTKRNIRVDYVPASYLCGDSGEPCQWTGAPGASLARQPGEALSPTIGEEFDKRGESAPIFKDGPDQPAKVPKPEDKEGIN